MNGIKIRNSKLKGRVEVPSSKSISHRAIICASLCSEGESILHNLTLSDDIEATIEGMNQLGAEISMCGDKAYIRRNNMLSQIPVIDCRESGSTLRFLIPIGLVLYQNISFYGSQKLLERPLDVYYDIFNKQSIEYTVNDRSLDISGKLLSGTYEIPGNISSQFISGLLFSLPLLDDDSEIIITDGLESRAYVDLTIDVLNKFGITIVQKNENSLYIPGKQSYKSCDYTIECDYSQAAFFLVANELGNEIECVGLNIDSLQGDREIINIIRKFKEHSDEVVIDASQVPDLVPIVTVLAALREGCTTVITNAQRLRLKESDRLKAISTEMNKLGASIKETEDGLIIYGKKELKGGVIVNSWHDHRIAMSLAIAATNCKEEITLYDHMAVNKSYPNFWQDFRNLGGLAIELNDR
jgi:3-phosphoshikimate 1-carboxyvinyltransferase